MPTDDAVTMTDADLAFFRGQNFGHIATLGADGSPHSVAVWIDTEDGRARFNSSDGSAHMKHLARDPRIAISGHDQANPYQAITLIGTAVLTHEGADEHVDALTRKYMDLERFPDEWRAPGTRRVKVEIVPARILRYGY